MTAPGDKAGPAGGDKSKRDYSTDSRQEGKAWIDMERLEEPPGTVVLVLGGYLQKKEARELTGKIDSLVVEGIKNIVLDMSNVQYVNSSAVGAFTNWASSARAQGGRVVLLSMRANIRMIFVTLGLLGMFITASSREEALKALS